MIIRKSIILILLIFLFSGCSNNTINISTKLYEYETDTIFGILTIPKINLEKEIYPLGSPLNDVNKNILYIDTGIPNTYLFAAHSGIGNLAYFNSLYKLSLGDLVYFKINNEELIFEVRDIKRVKKSGKIDIKNEENMIILTTCDEIVKGYQLIIEGKKAN